MVDAYNHFCACKSVSLIWILSALDRILSTARTFIFATRVAK